MKTTKTKLFDGLEVELEEVDSKMAGAEKRRKIEKKLEADAEREKQQYRQETQELIEKSQQEQARITRLQQKMELVSEHEALVAETKKLQNFICTHAKPRIFWLPKTMTSAAQTRLKDSKRVVDKMLKEKSDALEREINEVMEREERIRSRLRRDSTGMPDKENADDEHHSRGEKESTKDTARSSRHSRDKKSSHHEAKKKQSEMHYEDEDEEMEEEVEGSRIELGDREVVVAPKGGEGEGSKGEKKGLEGGSVKEEGAVMEVEGADQVPKKLDAGMGSFDDGNNTDVDYDDDEVHNTGEMQSSFTPITAIPLPDDTQVTAKAAEKKEDSADQNKQSEAASQELGEAGSGGTQFSGASEVREEQLYMERGQEVLRATATMAEDEADMEEDPADE
nr:hypothetical protein BaRGS_022096 [Batillaria attramentaria]